MRFTNEGNGGRNDCPCKASCCRGSSGRTAATNRALAGPAGSHVHFHIGQYLLDRDLRAHPRHFRVRIRLIRPTFTDCASGPSCRHAGDRVAGYGLWAPASFPDKIGTKTGKKSWKTIHLLMIPGYRIRILHQPNIQAKKPAETLERAMRFELTTPTLARLCSTPELRPLTSRKPDRGLNCRRSDVDERVNSRKTEL